ncbi:NCS1 family nucleobase:cation symporter-1 [Endozoicomonas sp. SM1973]|uniref:NCS1 family nucleobase:cation symporter-1 n=1 Tax=Spartinivicinus marinus TaxID=2994442 RepID=A0A853HZY4_9GAMM|nr:NCS1 family nucleobase:cation symporter-1 [Spartinivicinus marinus]MCX4030083.1 NCS1 family nucleobase:cation symporter-1 [Spartinivicinus marinus]NYZ64672.1 NCS1 family nucleobase:cation symporter-1 [Spartinivicinus marinus]
MTATSHLSPNHSQSTSTIEHLALHDSAYYNPDIAPTLPCQRTWTKWHIAALWVGMAICVPTYMLGGVLTSYFGLSVGEALITILLANIVILIPLTLNACPGTQYGIPFPVVLRSSFGIVGSNIPCLIRALVACGWFGIQTLFGGLAIHILLSTFFDGWASLASVGEVIGFFIFLILNLIVVIKGANAIKWLETLSAPLLLLVGIGLMAWAMPHISMEQLLEEPAKRPATDSVWHYFFAGLTAMVGFWATLSLNIPDFSRYAQSQKAQITGQIIGLPLTMFFFAALGVVMTAASPTLVGETIADPIHLIGKIENPLIVAVSMSILIIATLSTNTAANVVSPTNDIQNIAPKYINQTTGVLLTGLIGVVLMSWELLKKLGLIASTVSVESLYSNWLIGYSCLLGPIAGIMIVDYFIIKQQRLDIRSLYTTDGHYPRFNKAGFIALIIPTLITFVAIMYNVIPWFYDYGWFTGSLTGGLIYYLVSPSSQTHYQLVTKSS